MTVTNCVHNVSLNLECKMCEKENKEYVKEMAARGLDIPDKVAELQ